GLTPTATTVRFSAGDTSPRLVEIPLREDDETEPEESFTVQLGDVRCATLGARNQASVDIVDDDQVPTPPPPPGFTIGGTVDGLQGTGLVLTDLGADAAVSADAPFTLPGTHQTGERYDVEVTAQPQSPEQVCSVQNGSGTVSGADVTDVAVRCETPAARVRPPPPLRTTGRGAHAPPPTRD